MSVCVEGDVDVSMAQMLGDRFVVDTGTQHSRSAGMAGIMQTDLGEVVFFEKALPLLRQGIGGIGLTVGLAHHKTFVKVNIVKASSTSVLLALLLSGKHVY